MKILGIRQDREDQGLVLLTDIKSRCLGRGGEHPGCLIPTAIEHSVPIDAKKVHGSPGHLKLPL